MDKRLIQIFDKIITDKYTKTIHKTYYSNEYYLTNIFEMLNDINRWETLKKLKTYNPLIINGKEAKSHYETIRKKFNKWSNDGIFEMAFEECINYNKINKSIELSIDTTFINNKYGIEDIALNIDNKKKRASKISIISDKNKFIYSIISIKINIKKEVKIDKRSKKYRDKKNKRMKRVLGFVHDVETIQNSLNKINKIYNFSNITLLGDKGYISKKKYKYNNKEVDLLTCKKKNQKQNDEKTKNILKERIYVENAIGIIKKSERVMTRKDHNIKNYMSFVYLASLKNNLKKINDF